jgi:hypothetical protein
MLIWYGVSSMTIVIITIIKLHIGLGIYSNKTVAADEAIADAACPPRLCFTFAEVVCVLHSPSSLGPSHLICLEVSEYGAG